MRSPLGDGTKCLVVFGGSWIKLEPTNTLQNSNSSWYLSCSFTHNPKTGSNCPQNVRRRQDLIPKVEFLPGENLPSHFQNKLGYYEQFAVDAQTQICLGEVFLVSGWSFSGFWMKFFCACSSGCSRSSSFPIYPPFFLHFLPNSELVMFIYMPPMLLAAGDDLPFLKCIFFSPPNICISERQSWI